jgi:hypothetical protein
LGHIDHIDLAESIIFQGNDFSSSQLGKGDNRAVASG